MAQAISDVMTRDPATIGPHDSAADAARRMRQVDSGAILVCEDGHLKGLVTDRDIVVRAVAEGRDPARVEVHEICSGDLGTLRPNDDLDRLAGERAAREAGREHARDAGGEEVERSNERSPTNSVCSCAGAVGAVC